MAWQSISPDVMVKGFRKCCMSNGMDGTDNNMLWHSNGEEGNVMSECEEDEETDCEDRDSDTDWLKVVRI